MGRPTEYHTDLGAIALTAEPGTGTRYRLYLVQDIDGGLLVAWPDGGWIGRAFHKGTSLVHVAGKRPPKVDVIAIGLLVRQAYADAAIPSL